MKKKFISIAKQAMVWTLAASMVIGTPLTASAKSLNEIFKVEDNYGGTVSQDGPNDTVTGTVSNTVTKTDSGVLAFDDQIAGIVLSESNVEMELVGGYDPDPAKQTTTKLTVTVCDEAGKALSGEGIDKLLKKFTWRTGNSAVVSLRNEKGKNPATAGVTDEMTLVARKGGSTKVTVSLDDNENNIHYSATANVVVKQYADELGFSEYLEKDFIEGSTLDLDEYVTKNPESASDKITYAIVKDGSKAATLKNNVLTLKKNMNAKGAKVTLVAIGEKVKSKPVEFDVLKANPANKIEFYKGSTATGAAIGSKGFAWDVNTYGDANNEKMDGQDFVAKLITKDGGDCTDRVASWTSKKPDIVAVKEVVPGDDRKNTQIVLSAKSAGTAQITAKTSSGKSASFKVVVSANLTDIQVVPLENAYSGQTVQLDANQFFANNGSENFTDAGLKWELCDKDGATNTDAVKGMKKVASVNAKGILTIKPSITYKQGKTQVKVEELYVRALNSKKIVAGSAAGAAGSLKADPIKIGLTQISITSITVYGNTTNNDTNIVAKMEKQSNGKMRQTINKPVSIAVDGSRTYGIVATGKVEGQDVESEFLPDGTPVAAALGWISANTKVVKATRNNSSTGNLEAIKKGSANITVSGSYEASPNKYTAIKATFKATVTQPTKSITMTTKNNAIPAKTGSVNFKVTMDKGTSTKANEIVWTVTRTRGNEKTDFTFKNGASINLPLKDNQPDATNNKEIATAINVAAGDKFTVRARIVSSGLSTSKTLEVVKPSLNVKIESIAGSDNANLVNNNKAELTLTNDTKAFYTMNPQIQVVKNGDFENLGSTENMATVSYTVNKQGIVQIYGDKIYPLQAGKVNITPVSSDGKKGRAIAVTVKLPEGN